MHILSVLYEYDLMEPDKKKTLIDVGRELYAIDVVGKEIENAKSGAIRCALLLGLPAGLLWVIFRGTTDVTVLMATLTVAVCVFAAYLSAHKIMVSRTSMLREMVKKFHNKYHADIIQCEYYKFFVILRFLEENKALPLSILLRYLPCRECKEQLEFIFKN